MKLIHNSYLFERCTLKLGLRRNTMRSIVFKVDPMIKIMQHVIKNTRNEVSFTFNVRSSFVCTLLIFSMLLFTTLLFSMFRSNKSFCIEYLIINLFSLLHGRIALVRFDRYVKLVYSSQVLYNSCIVMY